MKRRLIAGFLTLCMIVSLCPPSAFAVHSSASEMTEPETVVTEPAADTGAPEETAAPDPVPSEPQKEPEPTQPEETLPEGTQPEGTLPAQTQPAQTQPAGALPAQTQPAGTLPEGEEYSYRSISVGQTVTLTTGLAEGGSWTSDNLAAATVTSAEGDTLNALVYGVAAGVTTVTYTADGAEERWVVYVNDPAVQTGETTGETVAAEAPADSEQATVEDQPQGGSVLDKLGGLLTGAADTQAAAASITATQKTIYVGDTITLTGPDNTYWRCDYTGEWESRDPAKAEVSGTGTSATLKGLAAGTVTVAYTYCKSSSWRNHAHSYETETIEIKVQAPTLTVSGADTVAVGVPTQLMATAEPAGAKMNLTWESSDADTLTVTQDGIITGVKAGTATVTVTDASTGVIATYNVTVRNVVPVTDVTLTGVDTMAAFTTTQLTANITPENADWTGMAWESSNNEILTVNDTGLVTAVAPGKALVTLTVTSADGTEKTAQHTITVTDATESTAQAEFYYLRSPDKDPNSNETDNWGSSSLGIGTVNMTNATWDENDKNCFSVSGRVVSWPSGCNGGEIPRNSTYWTEIFNAYKSSVEAKLGGVSITADDVQYIKVHPYKISQHNHSTPDFHVDCRVEVKTRNVYTATYYLWDAGSTSGYEWKASAYYKDDKATKPEDFTAISNLPETQKVNGVTYTFDGWYTNETRTGSKVSFPYTLNENTTFYAKYVAGYQVTYNLNGGKWDGATTFSENEGATVRITSMIPRKDGYKFIGWTSENITEEQIKARTFTMPNHNVTLIAQWEKSDFTVKYRYIGLVPTGAPAEPGNTTKTYGATVNVADKPTLTGYNFIGWNTDDAEITNGTFTMPAKDVTLSGSWEKKTVGYTVEYYYDGIRIPSKTETGTAVFGDVINKYTEKPETGYKLDHTDNLPLTIGEDESANVIKVFYTKRTDLSYKVNYLEKGTNNVLHAQKVQNGMTFGTTVAASDEAIEIDGYTYNSADKDTLTITTGENVINLYYTKRTDLSYKVNYLEKGTDNVLRTQKVQGNVTFGTTVVASDEAIEIDGYKYDSADKATLPITTGENVINLYYTRRTDLYAIVNYYWNGTGEKAAPSKELHDRTLGEAWTESPIKIQGYTIATTSSKTVTIQATGNVINFYYYKNVELTAKSKTETYNGNVQTVEGYTGAPADADFSTITVSVSGTDAGTYDAKFADGTVNTVDAAGKYIVTKATNGKLTINKRTVTLTSASDHKQYDGTPLTNANVAVTGDGFVDGEVTGIKATGSVTHVAQNEVTNTITYTEGANFKASNYTITKNEGKLSITPIAIELTAASDSKTYDGTALTNNSHEITHGKFVGEEGLATVTVAGSQTLVGSSANAITGYTLKDNTAESDYTITTRPGTLTVNARGEGEKYAITVKAKSGSFTYDGTEHTVSGFESLTFPVNGKNYTVEGLSASASATDATETAIPVTVTGTAIVKDAEKNDVTAQFTVATENGTLTVAKRTVTLTSETASKPYDGTPLEKPDVTVTGSFVTGEVTGIKATGSVTHVAQNEVTNTITYTEGANFKASNYTITKNEGKLSITPIAIELTAASDSKTYDGTALTNNSHEITHGKFVGEEGLATVTVAGSQTLVGSSANAITGYTLKDNTAESDYTITTRPGTLTVNARGEGEKYAITVKAKSGSFTYDGTEHTVSGFESLTFPVNGKNYTVEGLSASASATDATETAIPVTVTGTAIVKDAEKNDVTAQFTVATENGTLTVAKRTVTLTSGSANKEYDGTELTKHEVTVGGEGFVTGEGADYSYTGSQKLVGSSANYFTYTLNAGTGEGNYNITVHYGELEVTNRTDKYTINVEANSGSKTYDGTALKVEGFKTLSFTVNGQTYTVSGLTASAEGTNVSDSKAVTVTGTAIVRDAANNDVTDQFAVTTKNGKLTINPVAIELTAASGSKPYDGTALTNNGYTITSGEFVGEEGLASVTVEGSQTLVGFSNNVITGHKLKEGTLSENYTITYVNGELKVTDRTEKYAIEVEANSGSKTYDGTALKVEGFKTLSFTVNDQIYTVSGLTASAEGTNVSDSKTVTVTGTPVVMDAAGNEVTDQFTVTTKNGTLTINPVAIELTADSASKEYDGMALTKDTYTITNGKFVGEDGLASVTVVGSQTLVGSGKNVITGHELKEGTLPENYAISYMDGELKVTDRAEKYTITVKANSGSKTYDGTKLTVDGFETLSFTVNDQTYTVEGLTAHAEGTNVSDSAAVEVIGTPVVKDAAGNEVTAQFTVNPVNGNLTITPASVTVTADNKSKVFGAAEPELTATVTGTLNGDKVAYTLSRASGENVGSYPIIPTGEKVQGNYEVTYKTGTLTITPITGKIVVTVTGHTGTAVYDGTAHTVTGYDVAASNPLYTAADFAFDGTASVTGTDAGGYPMGLAESQFRNASANFTEVSFVVNDGGLTVDKRPVTLTSVTDSKVYDRTPLTRSDVTVGGMGFVSGEVTDIRATGSVLNVSEGTVPNPIEFTPAAAYKAGNYTIEYHVGTLSVTPAARATVVVTGKTATFVYDGQPHTVTGFTNDGRSRDITVTLLRAGADSVTGTEINRYNMGLTAADFIASSPNYRKVDVEVVDGYLDIVTINVNVTITVRGNRDTVTYDGSEHNVTGYEIVSITTNVGRNVTMEGLTLKLRGNASATGTEPGTYPMGLTAADFDVDTTIYRGVRVVVEDGELVIKPEAVPEAETEPTETVPDESAPKGQPEDIPDEDVPMAAPAWALLNLILSLLTVLGSLFLLSGLFGKKKEEATDENGNLILDDNGESVMNRIKQRAGWRIISLLPAIGSVIAFILTENMRNPMVLVDRWTLLMVIIAVIQVLVMMLSKKKVEETEEA